MVFLGSGFWVSSRSGDDDVGLGISSVIGDEKGNVGGAGHRFGGISALSVWSLLELYEDTILTVGSLEEEEKEDRGREKKREIY